jgi:hypothetical protein
LNEELFVLTDGKGQFVHITGMGGQGGLRNFVLLHHAARDGAFSHYLVTDVRLATEFQTRVEAILANFVCDTAGVFDAMRIQTEDQYEWGHLPVDCRHKF